MKIQKQTFKSIDIYIDYDEVVDIIKQHLFEKEDVDLYDEDYQLELLVDGIEEKNICVDNLRIKIYIEETDNVSDLFEEEKKSCTHTNLSKAKLYYRDNQGWWYDKDMIPIKDPTTKE